MPSTFYAGVVISGGCWTMEVVNEKDLDEIFHQAKVDEFEKDSGSLVTRIEKFIRSELDQTVSCSEDIVNLAIAIDHLFEYGEEFLVDLHSALSSTLGRAGCVYQANIRLISIHSLDASAYSGLVKGIVIKADGCVSIAAAAAGEDGLIMSIGERGHMIGDPGSAYWIANKCLRMIYDNSEGVELTKYDLTAATKAAYEHFEMTNPLDILKPLYSDFSKLRITSFCEKLGQLAKQDDEFSQYLFAEAGIKLGRLIKALYTNGKFEQKDLEATIVDGTITIMVAGRVWNYYNLLRQSFLQTVQSELKPKLTKPLHKLEILKLGFGSAYSTALYAMRLRKGSEYEWPRLLQEHKHVKVQLLAEEIID